MTLWSRLCPNQAFLVLKAREVTFLLNRRCPVKNSDTGNIMAHQTSRKTTHSNTNVSNCLGFQLLQGIKCV